MKPLDQFQENIFTYKEILLLQSEYGGLRNEFFWTVQTFFNESLYRLELAKFVFTNATWVGIIRLTSFGCHLVPIQTFGAISVPIQT